MATCGPSRNVSRLASSTHSRLLSIAENEQVLAGLAKDSVSLATAVAQLYVAFPSRHSWSKSSTGVVCLVKDPRRKSYFIQLLTCTAREGSGRVVFEQELYVEMRYKHCRAFFHMFAGDRCQVGLNFADEGEALHFMRQVENCLACFKTQISNPHPAIAQPSTHLVRSTTYSHPSREKQPDLAPSSGSFSTSSLVSARVNARLKKTIRLSKADISSPSNFKHLSHLGIGQSDSFGIGDLNKDWQQVLKQAGVKKEDLEDQNTACFIKNYVRRHSHCFSDPSSEDGIHDSNQLDRFKPRVAPHRQIETQKNSAVPAKCPAPGAQQKPHQRSKPMFFAPPPPRHAPQKPSTTATANPEVDSLKDLMLSNSEGQQLGKVEEAGVVTKEEKVTGMAQALASALADRHCAMHSDEDDYQYDDDEWDD